MNRRQFVRASSLATAGLISSARLGLGQSGTFGAAIIGHTGCGNYGHDLDLVFNDLANVTVLAVADPDANGRAKAMQRCQAAREYADYREMLQKEKPQLVSIASRWSDQHFAMGKAALKARAHLLVEKPFTQTLDEADELLSLAKAADRRIAVAHQMRLSPGVVRLKEEIGKGLIGDLLQIRSWGKQDHRAGGEDLIVLGTHVFDMMRLFAGDPISCAANVWHRGDFISGRHVREAAENVGPVAGDEIEAQFTFANGVVASFTSRERLRQTLGAWAVELIGTKGMARILMNIDPEIYISPSQSGEPSARNWQRYDAPGQSGVAAANRRVVVDWLESIDLRRDPSCSGYNGMKALEMVMAVYASALNRATVSFPLKDRRHPLAGGQGVNPLRGRE